DGQEGEIIGGEWKEKGEVELGEAVAGGGPAVGADEVAGLPHVGRLGVVPGELEGEVGLDGAAQLEGPAGVDAPAALCRLLGEDVAGRLAADFIALTAEEGQEEDVLRLEDGVPLQLADPVAVGLL